MSFTSILSKIGQGAEEAVNVIAQIEGFEPVIKALIPQTTKVQSVESKIDVSFTDITNIAKQVEVMAGASNMTSQQKLAAATAILQQMLQVAGQLTNVGDATLVSKGIGEVMQGVVDIQNGLKA